MVRNLIAGVRALLQRAERNAQIEDELKSFFESSIEDKMRRGMSPEEAQQAARIEIGSGEMVRHKVWAVGWESSVATMMRELRFAARQLRKSPGFTVTALLTLALGIGTTTAIFTLVYDAMLRSLPFAQAGRLVTIQEIVAEWQDLYPTTPVNANHFTFWEEHSHSFAAMAAMREESLPLGAQGRPLQVGVLSATPGISSVLDVRPSLGRAFTSAEAQPGHDRVAVLMDPLWREQFGSDPGILGKTVRLNGFPYTVVGVMPRSFHMPPVETIASKNGSQIRPLGLVIPLAFENYQLEEAMGDMDFFGLARLKPGVSLAAANAELNAEQHTISESLPADQKATLSTVLTPWQQELVGSSRTPLMLLLAAVGGLLLVGCVNIANLLLARAAGQRQQIAVAAALGAGRAEMLGMALRESVVLAAGGCALGLLLAIELIPAMQRYLPRALNFRGPLHLDWMSAACAVGLTMTAALLAGAAPAWVASGTAPQEVLHSEAKLASESRGSRRIRRVLVGVEVAVSAVLVGMTGLLTLSMVKLMHVNRGFDPERTMTAQVDLPRESYPSDQRRAEFYKDVLGRLNSLPGVQQAAIIAVLPLSGDAWGDSARIIGDGRSWTQLMEEHFRWMSPGYFAAIRLPLVEGRALSASDWGKNVAIVSESTAKALWPGKDPVGQQFHRGGVMDEDPFTVIGVVKDARTITLAKPDPMMIYVPYWYRCDEAAGLVVRTRQNPAMMGAAIRKTIWNIDASVPVPTVQTLGAVVSDSVANRRFEMDLLLLFAASALLLAALGVCGVVTYSVVQRRKEIGLRLAVGAQRGSLYRMVLREGITPVIIGAAVGLAATFGMAHILQSLLFEVSPYNPEIAAGTLVLLIAVGSLACILPARRAASTDPIGALRAE